jgi:hypothetical protein
MERMTPSWTRQAAMLALIVALNVVFSSQAGAEPPTAEVAKRCLHYAYMVYPWKRPGAVPMSGDREAWFRSCLAKNGEVPEPEAPAKSQKSVPASKANSSRDASPPIQTSR